MWHIRQINATDAVYAITAVNAIYATNAMHVYVCMTNLCFSLILTNCGAQRTIPIFCCSGGPPGPPDPRRGPIGRTLLRYVGNPHKMEGGPGGPIGSPPGGPGKREAPRDSRV